MTHEFEFIRLSICIPTYNGEPAIRSLIDRLLASSRSDLEIVVSDDKSTDGTWDFVATRSAADPRLRVERNAENIGMDRNFAHAVQLARGDYVWLCGQDDIIDTDGIDRVMTTLESDPSIDFVFMNHAKRELTPNGEILIPGPDTRNAVEGVGIESFLAHTGNLLPTFLPTYLIKRSRWQDVNVETYLGTCYCQVGVFLEQPETMHWYHFPGTHVTGLQPLDGWQTNVAAYARIALGHFAMLHRARLRAIGLSDTRWAALCEKQGRRLIYALILWRHKGFSLDASLPEETGALLRAVSPAQARLFDTIIRSPRVVSSLLFGLVAIKRRLRALLSGQGA